MPGTMVQIRNMSEELHRRLKVRAAVEGMSMTDYAIRELRKALDRPTRQEVLERLKARPVRRVAPSPAEVIRSGRATR
jgi:antitoxin FitA